MIDTDHPQWRCSLMAARQQRSATVRQYKFASLLYSDAVAEPHLIKFLPDLLFSSSYSIV